MAIHTWNRKSSKTRAQKKGGRHFRTEIHDTLGGQKGGFKQNDLLNQQKKKAMEASKNLKSVEEAHLNDENTTKTQAKTQNLSTQMDSV